jgi:nitrogen regulatory protein P-II
MEFISTPKALFFYSLKIFHTGGTIMKKLEIIIKPEKLENLKSILDDCKASGVMISNIMGYGNQRGYTQMYRGTEYAVNLLPKVKVETVVSEEIANHIIEKVVQKITTGTYGDGKIFVYDVVDAVRIRTGEHGEDAL